MPVSITFRANKGKALNYDELDANFGAFFYSSSLVNNGQTLRLHYTSSLPANVNEPAHDISLNSGLGISGADRRVAFYTGSNALTTAPGFIVSGSKVGIGLDEVTDLPITYQLEVSGSIKASGTVIQGSDARLKENIKAIPFALDKLDDIEGVVYNKIGNDKREPGFIAQDIQKIIPEVVYEDNKGYLGVNYSGVVPYLVEAIKELKQEIKELKSRL